LDLDVADEEVVYTVIKNPKNPSYKKFKKKLKYEIFLAAGIRNNNLYVRHRPI
jgi:hypothetical protein